MRTMKDTPEGYELRQQAERKFNTESEHTEPASEMTPEKMKGLIQELQSHQIELEMQNEELRRMQDKLEKTRARHFDLYDFAPMGYVTLSEQGLILEANLAASTLLGLPRSALVRQPISRFILGTDQDIYYEHEKRLFETGEHQVCELQLVNADGAIFWGHLEAITVQGDNGAPVSSVLLSDITEHKWLKETQEFLLQCGLPITGEDFFESLARYLAETLGMEYVCIDRLEGDGLTAQTVAIHNDGKFESNVRYALKDTPCGVVVNKSACCYPRGIQKLFPKDTVLQELKAESYFGTTLFDSKGYPIGLIAIIGHHDLKDPERAKWLLNLVVPRAAGELERRRAEEQIKASLKEKEVLLSEVHHRVKNNMQVIISLLRLQSSKIEDKQYADMFKNAEDRIRSMALIHEKLYRTKDFAKIDFNDYAKDLANHLIKTYSAAAGKIKLNMNIEDIHIGLGKAIPCGLIINELLSNSLKYAFPKGEGGEIKIVLRAINSEEVELTVRDDGIGISKEMDILKTESLGLQLVHILVEDQLDGSLEVDREEGTAFKIRFKK